jgi:hypothetical protein
MIEGEKGRAPGEREREEGGRGRAEHQEREEGGRERKGRGTMGASPSVVRVLT